MTNQPEPRSGDLVETSDGHYAIVTNSAMREIFLSNGLREVLDRDVWNRLRCLSMLTGDDGAARANFAELLRARA